MASPSTSLSLQGSLPPYLKHMIRCFPPPPPTCTHPTCAIRAPSPPQRPSVERGTLESRRQILETFRYTRQIAQGWLEIHHVKDDKELEAAALLLAEPYSRAMHLSDGTMPVAAFVLKQDMAERRVLVPHVALLVGFYYKDRDGEEAELACTADISFDAIGAHPSPGTPRPPKEYPYIGNVAVKKTLRRKGIGSQLIKACEELIIQMKAERKVYLHCRVTDTGPLRLYEKTGYKVVKTDSILVWLRCKPRRYLMSKELPLNTDEKQSDASDCKHCPI
ncbi:GCN5-related N-acetyltransferase 5, chloroplastic-like [Elaeis guineensis]|uniref:Uncharacterized protein LOC105050575 n=1 Tax=Elaeis guineensis var. tenera TaxID=51953 RepID=A0A6I9RMS1_ELAGV|nr:uncharacterized protein LOC105050575 [Elaeis guineensis]